jgi:hypothetical protein
VVKARHAELAGDRSAATALLRQALSEAERLEPRRVNELREKLSSF